MSIESKSLESAFHCSVEALSHIKMLIAVYHQDGKIAVSDTRYDVKELNEMPQKLADLGLIMENIYTVIENSDNPRGIITAIKSRLESYSKNLNALTSSLRVIARIS